jgi:O-antigen/teichoic acid export membrane protein
MLANVRIARILAPDGYGQYNLVIAVASIGSVLTSLGLRNVVIRECARHPEKSASLLFFSMVNRATVMVLVSIGIIIYSQYNDSGFTISLGAITVGLLIGQVGWDLLETIAFGHERMHFSALINFIGSLIWVLLAWIVPQHWLTAFTVGFAFALLQIGKAIVYSIISKKAGYFSGNFNFFIWKECGLSLISQSIPFYWLSILTASVGLLPVIFLSNMGGTTEVGFYNVSNRLINPMQLLILTAFSALYPGLSKIANNGDGNQFLRTIKQGFISIIIIGTTAAILVSLLRREIVFLLFGSSYLPAADVLAYQCWYSALFYIYNLIGLVLASRDKQNLLGILSTCNAIIAMPILWWGASQNAVMLSVAGIIQLVLNLPYHWVVFQRIMPRPLPGIVVFQGISIMTGGMILAALISPDFPLLIRAMIILVILAGLSFILPRKWISRFISKKRQQQEHQLELR